MNKTFIIAEAGVNHNGSLELAKKLVDVAVEAKVDAVKFQTFKSESLVSEEAPKAHYQKEQTGDQESQLEMIKKLELSYENFEELISYCRERKILFLSTPFDEESVDFLKKHVPVFKIPSGEITNLFLLEKISSTKKPVIISTGMATMEEITRAVKFFQKKLKKKEIKIGLTKIPNLSILHCTTAYPAPFEELNLKSIPFLRKKFGEVIGYSDHSLGFSASVGAVALGARIIEKHFTLDKSMEGPDHRASLDPNELKNFVNHIRELELSLGTEQKKPSKSDLENKVVARKSLYFSKSLKRGQVIRREDLTAKRPANGISPWDYSKIVGKKAKQDIQSGAKVSAKLYK